MGKKKVNRGLEVIPESNEGEWVFTPGVLVFLDMALWPIESNKPPEVTEDADFEVIQPKQLPPCGDTLE